MLVSILDSNTIHTSKWSNDSRCENLFYSLEPYWDVNKGIKICLMLLFQFLSNSFISNNSYIFMRIVGTAIVQNEIH